MQRRNNQRFPRKKFENRHTRRLDLGQYWHLPSLTLDLSRLSETDFGSVDSVRLLANSIKYKNYQVRTLNLSGNGLVSLDFFRDLLPALPFLENLVLDKNCIADVFEFEKLSALRKSLRSVSMIDNPVVGALPRVLLFFFFTKRFPLLQFLNGAPTNVVQTTVASPLVADLAQLSFPLQSQLSFSAAPLFAGSAQIDFSAASSLPIRHDNDWVLQLVLKFEERFCKLLGETSNRALGEVYATDAVLEVRLDKKQTVQKGREAIGGWWTDFERFRQLQPGNSLAVTALTDSCWLVSHFGYFQTTKGLLALKRMNRVFVAEIDKNAGRVNIQKDCVEFVAVSAGGTEVAGSAVHSYLEKVEKDAQLLKELEQKRQSQIEEARRVYVEKLGVNNEEVDKIVKVFGRDYDCFMAKFGR